MKHFNHLLKISLTALFALLLMLPFGALATADEGSEDEGTIDKNGMSVKKTVTVNDNGTYVVNLESFATGTVYTKTMPVDVVLVVDVSNSMGWEPGASDVARNYRYDRTKLYAAMQAADSLADIILTGEDGNKTGNSLSFVTFAGLDTDNCIDSLKSNFDSVQVVFSGEESADAAKARFDSVYMTNTYGLTYNGQGSATAPNMGGTNYDYAFFEAKKAINAVKAKYADEYAAEERVTFVIFMTDGAPSLYNDDKFSGNHNNEQGLADGSGYYNRTNQYTKDRWYDFITSNSNPYAESVFNSVNGNLYTIGFDLAHGGFNGNSWTESELSNFIKYMLYDGNTEAYARSQDNGKKILSVQTTSSAEELKEIFEQLAQTAAAAATDLGTSAVMKDIVSSSFTLPEGTKEDDIHISIVPWDSTTHNWSETTKYTIDEWKTQTAAGNYEAKAQENVAVSISEDGKTVDITGFDYSTHFLATKVPAEDKDGINNQAAKIVVYFTIYAKPSAVTGGNVATNGVKSGIYASADDKEAIINFPVPEVKFTPVTYVVDYVTSDTSTDTKASTIKLDYSGVLKNVQMLDDPSDDVLIGEKTSDFIYTIYKGKYGTISFGDDKTDVQRRYVRYAPTTMNWDGYDRIFVKGESASESDLDVWAMLCVVPANSVFYEDTYITQTKTVTYNGQQVTIEYTGIGYTGSWETVGTEGKNQTQHADKDGDGNPIPQGWIEGLSDDSDFANDMAHTSSTAKAKASFTFSGTGVDIYSRTNGSTGTISVALKSLAEDNESGKKIIKSKVIDNKAAAGDFYAVPVCTFTDLPYGKYTATITVTTGGKAEGRMTFYLDGVRVYNPIKPLEGEKNIIAMYGEKNLGAVFTEVRSLLGTDATAAALYIDEHTIGEEVSDLDAIEAAANALAEAQEAYDAYVEENVTPAKNAISTAEYTLQAAKDKETNTKNIYDVAKKAHDDAVEAGASAETIADLEAKMNTAKANWDDAVAEAATAQATYDAEITGLQAALDSAIAGKETYVAAIEAAREAYDEANEAVEVSYITEDVVADYNKDGPNSELYLSEGQKVAINVESGKYYFIGLRSLNGDKVTCKINGAEKELSHTVDLYYEATPAEGNTAIVIENTSDAILSITKLRTTGTGNRTNGVTIAPTEKTLAFVKSLASRPVTAYTGEILTEEEAAVEETVVENPAVETETEVTLEESDITIENPEPVAENENAETGIAETEPEPTPATNSFTNILSRLMSSFSRFFRR